VKLPRLPILSSVAASCFLASFALAEDTFFKPNDVIALVGGEDLVASADFGYLELFLQRDLPAHHLKMRALAWEGDTVYEQPRMLNYPILEQQLEQIGATIVFTQFGRMESMDGPELVAGFVAAYEKLLDRLQAGGKRRVLLIPPTPPPGYVFGKDTLGFQAYDTAVKALARKRGSPALPYLGQIGIDPGRAGPRHRDGVHLNAVGQTYLGMYVAMLLPQYRPVSTPRNPPEPDTYIPPPPSLKLQANGIRMADPKEEALRTAIVAKNRLWDRYRRPQNWAFLAGDRVTQPSSRDWRDPNKRWFPEEMEQFVPLIEAKEKQIWELAETLKGVTK
jgi:hypothetical protein